MERFERVPPGEVHRLAGNFQNAHSNRNLTVLLLLNESRRKIKVSDRESITRRRRRASCLFPFRHATDFDGKPRRDPTERIRNSVKYVLMIINFPCKSKYRSHRGPENFSRHESIKSHFHPFRLYKQNPSARVVFFEINFRRIVYQMN